MSLCLSRFFYLGYELGKCGLHIFQDKLSPVIQAPQSKNAEELRSFLSMLLNYRRIFTGETTNLSPLNALLHKNTPWVWNDEHPSIFNLQKICLASEPILVSHER